MKESRKLRISPDAGHALEKLGHAIEYLTDEFVHEGGCLSSHTGEVEAIQLLMARNREIYFACPVVPTWKERWMGFRRAHIFPARRTHDPLLDASRVHHSR